MKSFNEYSKLEEDFTKMDTPTLKKWINTRERNAMGGNLSKKRGDQYDQAQAEMKKRKANEEVVVEGYSEDDIANGGTVIYKHEGKHVMSKVTHKTGGGARTIIHTTSKHAVPLHHVVSTDASDWNRFKMKEEVEQIDELSKETLKSYVDKVSTGPSRGTTPKGTLKSIKAIGGVTKAIRKQYSGSNVAEEIELDEEIKKGDFVKDPYGKIHRVFDVKGTTLHTGEYRGNNGYGGTNSLHVTKATKVPTPKDVTEEAESIEELNQMTLSRYAGKARSDINTSLAVAGDKSTSADKSKAEYERIRKRAAGVKTANRKMASGEYSEELEMEQNMTESVDNMAAYVAAVQKDVDRTKPHDQRPAEVAQQPDNHMNQYVGAIDKYVGSHLYNKQGN